MMVGTKAIATLSTGYLDSLDTPRTDSRPDMTQMMDRAGRAHGDHRPPGRAPQPHAAEVVRRGHARPGPPRRPTTRPDPHGRGRRHPRGGPRHGQAGERPAAADGRRVCSRPCRSCSRPPCRPSAATASATTRSSSTYRDAKIDTLYTEGTTAIGPGLLLPQDDADQFKAVMPFRWPGRRVRQGRRGGSLTHEREVLRKGPGGHPGRDEPCLRGLGDGQADPGDLQGRAQRRAPAHDDG